MALSVRQTLASGIRQFTDHPQLWLTVTVAVAIFSSFLYVATIFISIAQDAEERLINVRVGAMQDAFQPLAREFLYEPEVLRFAMHDIAKNNPTIKDFFVIEKFALEGSESAWYTTISLMEEEEYTVFTGFDILLSLVSADPGNSYTIEEADGTERFFSTARAIVGSEGEVMGVIMTKQTLSEADLAISQSIARSIITLIVILLFLMLLFFKHARIVDYTVLYRRLKEVDTLKDDFISMASHELRTPLTSIRGYAELLREKNEINSDEGKQFLSRIDQSAEELDQLIADMLDVARLEQGRMKFAYTSCAPQSVIDEAIEVLSFSAKEKGLTLKSTGNATGTIKVDPTRLKQILINIIGNAVKYTQRGEVVVSTVQEAGKCIITISDTGVGMSAEAQKNIFKKFYRAPTDEVQSQVGTGLGLWITKQLVTTMKGSISVESIEGVGTHLLLSFPLEEK